MKILHTADWHLGQLFFEHDRTYEHQQFLNWLIEAISTNKIDVLLVSGDVFDGSNPPIAAVKMFYTFLNKVVKSNPTLQIIITAGNHDSPSRLESPKPLLESSNIHIIGLVHRLEEGLIDYEKLIIPLKSDNGKTVAYCLAVPYLRICDFPKTAEVCTTYVEGVKMFYQEIHEFATAKTSLPIIAMGHLHTAKAETSDDNSLERPIIGGEDCIPDSVFHDDMKYVALGHIHKAQKIGGKEHIRYSGSPIPMSFSELNYKHQVSVFEIIENQVVNIQSLEVPVAVPLLRVPAQHKPIHEVLLEITELIDSDTNLETTPYLEVRILEDGPDPTRKYKIQTALLGKHARLAKIHTKSPSAINKQNIEGEPTKNLDELTPFDVFNKIYQNKYQAEAPEVLVQLFNEVMVELNQKEA